MTPDPKSLAFSVVGLFALALLLVPTTPRPAWANGAAFFEEGDNPTGTVYFGFVKTAQGKALKGADVKITVNGKGKDAPKSYIIHSNVIGIWRLTQVDMKTDPRRVEVTAWMKGYKLVSKVKRSRSTKAGEPVQYDFVFRALD